MAYKKHLALLEQGVKVWNEWRSKNSRIKPNLRETNLSWLILTGANLSEANLTGADLTAANLSGANLSGANLSGADLTGIDFSGADLSGADLSKVNLSWANLSEANLSKVNLSWANLSEANLSKVDLSEADLSGANLSWKYLSRANLSRANLSGANLSGAIFDKNDFRKLTTVGANLSGINLSKVDLSEADLSGKNLNRANLRETILSGANLSRTQALKTNFEEAVLTGACIEDWNINSQTNLNKVICDYVYLKEGKQERRPHNPNKNFAPGEFISLVQKALETVDLIFSDGIEWAAFVESYQQLQAEINSDELSIQAIEKKAGGAFVIRVEVPREANKAEIEKYLKQEYEARLKVIEGEYQKQLQAKDNELKSKNEEINKAYREKSTDLMEMARIMASIQKPPTYNNIIEATGNKSVSETYQSKYNLNQAQVGGIVDTAQTGSNPEFHQHNYAPEQKQTLAEAAAEIQQLLIQLQIQGYSPEEARQKTANDLATKAKDDPTTLGKLVKWGQSLGDAAAKTTVTEAAREVVKLALRLSGVPLP